MIDIYRGTYDSRLNFFHGRKSVDRDEVVVKKLVLWSKHPETRDGEYIYAEPAMPGSYAFGGTLLFTSNSCFPEFTTPIKLHDRQMNLEDRGIEYD